MQQPDSSTPENLLVPKKHDQIESSPCLQGEMVTFTGTLASMTHAEGAEQVERNGGTAVSSVSKKLTLLVVGEEGWPLEEDGEPSLKLQHTIQLRAEGHKIRIIKESNWLQLLGMQSEYTETQQLHTPAMLSELLSVPVHIIRSWEREGLIQAEHTVGRLPYFNFSQISRARKLSHLLQEGVKREEIIRSLQRLQSVLNQTDWEGSAMEVLPLGKHIVLRDAKGIIEPQTKQRLLNFDDVPLSKSNKMEDITPAIAFPEPPSDDGSTATYSDVDWYVEGCRHAENDETDQAILAFRKALRLIPADAESHFHLADCLYRKNMPQAALERYYCAIECDPDYIEAWTQIGCLHAEQNQLKPACIALEMSLNIDPNFPDAHLHLAEVLYQSDRIEDAIPHWETYLQFDDNGPWADIAKQRLALVKNDVHSTE